MGGLWRWVEQSIAYVIAAAGLVAISLIAMRFLS
jgi:hypothetical protein